MLTPAVFTISPANKFAVLQNCSRLFRDGVTNSQEVFYLYTLTQKRTKGLIVTLSHFSEVEPGDRQTYR